MKKLDIFSRKVLSNQNISKSNKISFLTNTKRKKKERKKEARALIIVFQEKQFGLGIWSNTFVRVIYTMIGKRTEFEDFDSSQWQWIWAVLITWTWTWT